SCGACGLGRGFSFHFGSRISGGVEKSACRSLHLLCLFRIGGRCGACIVFWYNVIYILFFFSFFCLFFVLVFLFFCCFYFFFCYFYAVFFCLLVIYLWNSLVYQE